ncbi:hypothetical protein AAVH_29939, partial [Aphelenchoides avenae]
MADLSSVSRIARLVVDVPLLCFHTSVTICVLRRIIRKDPKFSTTFFKYYCLQSIADLTYYLTVLPNRTLTLIAFGVSLVVMPACGVPFAGKILYAESEPGRFVARAEYPWVSVVANAVNALCGILTCAATLVFETGAYLMYRRMAFEVRRKRRTDFLLLVYAVSQSAIHLVSAVFYSLHVLAAAIDSFALRVVANSALAYLMDVVCFSSPICLMIT